MSSISLMVARTVPAGIGLPLTGATYIKSSRTIFTSACLMGKRNPRKFFLGNLRGTIHDRKMRGKLPQLPYYDDVQSYGYKYDDVFHEVPEMVPELVVPDLTGCELKPYVSYRAADIHQSEYTAQDLFDAVYRDKITQDFKDNKLDELGNPLEPSAAENLSAEKAWILARKSGSDLFSERIPRQWECLEQSLIDKPIPQIAIYPDDITHPSESKRIPSNTPPSPPPRKAIEAKKVKQY